MHRSLLIMFVLSILLGCNNATKESESEPVVRSIEQRFGTIFTKVKPAHFKPPQFEALKLEFNADAQVSWGATGKDDNGNIYLGMSAISDNLNNSYLYQFNPKTNTLTAQGDTISQMKHSGVYKIGAGQNKLHSKIYQADDGYLYFTTYDEEGESVSREKPPTHGAHLWRKLPEAASWEHLLATKEALIALNSDGRYIYALGYWGHVLYQFDTLSRRFNRSTVGSIKGHVSRNLLVAGNGHVFVPKTIARKDGNNIAELIEFDNQLNIVATHALEHYFSESRYTDHGITAFTNIKKGHVYFATAAGALYKIERQTNNTNKVIFVRYFGDELDRVLDKQPNQPFNQKPYVTGMFSIDGSDFLTALGKAQEDDKYSWYIYESSTDTMVSYTLENINKQYILYGSSTRDEKGNLYVVGLNSNEKKLPKPAIFQLRYQK